MLDFEWDENKCEIKIAKHGMDFDDAHYLWDSPLLIVADNRKDYGEQRWKGTGLLNYRVMVVIFTQPQLDTIRIISLRKANHREINDHEKFTAQTRENCKIYSRTIKTYEKPH